jgi:hypothetical protein
MAIQWYYSRAGQRLGPIGSAELKQLADGGQLAPTDLVWKDGMAEWAPAHQVKGLFPEGALPEAAGPQEAAQPAQPRAGGGGDFFSGLADEPAVAATPLAQQAPPPAHAPPSVSRARRTSRKLSRQPASIADFFDLKFEYYLTPVLTKILWASALVLALLIVATTTITLTTGESILSALSGASAKTMVIILKTITWTTLVLSTVTWLVALRLACEALLVLANVAESLSSIDEKTGAR